MTSTSQTPEPTIIVIGLNHRTAPLDLRERFHFDRTQSIAIAKRLIDASILNESLILSTCNRLEIYGMTASPEHAQAKIEQLLADTQQFPRDDFRQYLYHHRGISCIHHGLRVIGSLDSLILGEPQIIGQVKDAYRYALEAETLGFYLNKFFTHAFSTAKRIRTETRIGEGAVSVGYAACELGRQIFGSLEGKNVLVIGAGEIGELIVSHLTSQALGDLFIANRHIERANALKACFGGTVIPFDDIHNVLARVDIIMSSIAVEQAILSKNDIEPVIKARKAPLFLIDVSVPRSLDPNLHTLESVYLYNIDDLKQAISKNQEDRLKEAEKAERIVEEEAESLYRHLFNNEIAPTISSLSQKLHDIKLRELEKTFTKNPTLSAENKDAMARCADAIVNKILHEPILQLKTRQSEGSKLKHLIESVSSLFNLD